MGTRQATACCARRPPLGETRSAKATSWPVSAARNSGFSWRHADPPLPSRSWSGCELTSPSAAPAQPELRFAEIGETVESVVARADEQLYEAKAGGRDQARLAGVSAVAESAENETPATRQTPKPRITDSL